MNAAGAAVERVMDEEITLHTEDAVAGGAGEHLRTQTQVWGRAQAPGATAHTPVLTLLSFSRP